MTYNELHSTNGEAQTIVDTALRTAAPAELEPGHVYAFHTATGVHKVDLTGPEYRDFPYRKVGTTGVRDADSFATYWDKHHDQYSEVYADADRLSITAVLDAHTADSARWGSHRLQLMLRTTDAWKAWAEMDGRLMGQEQFAEFLEDHLPELLEPDAATMLEIAQSMQASTKAEFQSGHRLQDGQRQLKYVEQTTAKAGAKGDITIPETFVVGLVPFEGSEGYRLGARLRYRIADSTLRIGYKLDRPDDVRRTAFGDVVTTIGQRIGQPVMDGTPSQ